MLERYPGARRAMILLREIADYASQSQSGSIAKSKFALSRICNPTAASIYIYLHVVDKQKMSTGLLLYQKFCNFAHDKLSKLVLIWEIVLVQRKR